MINLQSDPTKTSGFSARELSRRKATPMDEPRKFFGSLGGLRRALHGILLRTSYYSSLEDLERNADEISKLIDRRLEGQ